MSDVLPNRAEWLRTQSRTAASDSLAALNTAAGLKHWAVSNKDTTVTVADEFVFRGHTKTVNVVAFSPNGNAVASGSNDTTAIVWDLDLGTWRRLACDIAKSEPPRAVSTTRTYGAIPRIMQRVTLPIQHALAG